MDKISRRQFFVRGTTACLCLSGLGASLNTAHADSHLSKSIEKYGGFKMGLQSYSLRRLNLKRTIESVSELGLHWVEFFPGHFGVTTDESRIAEVKDLLAPHDMHMYVHGVHGFGGDAEANRRIFEFAKLAGISLISAHPASNSFESLNDLVQEFDIKIGIHNHGPGHTYDLIEDSLRAVEPWDKRIGFCPDTGHCMRSGENPVDMVLQMNERLYGMHLKDHAHIGRDGPPETILGEGAIDLPGLCAAMREIGFDHPISLEYELGSPMDGIRKGLSNFAAAAN